MEMTPSELIKEKERLVNELEEGNLELHERDELKEKIEDIEDQLKEYF